MAGENAILNVYDKNGVSGVKQVVLGITELRKSTNLKVYTLCLRNIEDKKEDSKYDYYFNSSSKLNIFSFIKFHNIIKRENIKIIHSHQGKSLLYSFLYKIFFDRKIFLIQHEHGEIFYDSFLYKFLLKISKEKINLVLPCSNAVGSKLMEKIGFPRDKIKIIYNFVDLDKFKRKTSLSKQSKFTIGFVGRLSKVKGCEYLIKSLSYLEFNFECLIVGDGELKSDLIQLVEELNLRKKVQFLGYKKDIEKIYPLFDVLVMPSLSEASPMVFYEAQAFGVPIIGSNIPAVNEFVIPNRNGLLFRVKDYLDLSEKINKYFFEKNIWKKMQANSIQGIKHYSLKNYLKKLEKIYER
jgi:glycosyltransferase involved in cell wall biosynthesis